MRKALLLLTAAAVSIPAFPQDKQPSEPPAVLEIVRESIKEGRTAAHEKVEMDWVRTMRKANSPAHYIALDSMSGPTEAWFLVAFPSFEAVEKADAELHKPAMKPEMDMLDSRDGELRGASRTMYAVYRKDLSFHPERISVTKSRYWMISSLRLRTGHMSDFMRAAKLVLEAQEKANTETGSVAYQVISGSSDSLIMFFEPVESLKVLDQMQARRKEFAEAMGEEKMRAFEKDSAEAIASVDTNMFSVNPRMSYMPKSVEDNDPAYWRPKMPAKPAAEKPKEVKEKAGQ